MILPTQQTLDITMTKVNGSLGFTLRKENDSHRGGHHVSALVRPPATTDGQLCVGDRIDLVNDTPVDRMRHEELVLLLRSVAADVPVRLVVCRQIDEQIDELIDSDKGRSDGRYGQQFRTNLPPMERETRRQWCERFATDDRLAASC